jgi:hypothetical protein
MSSTLEYGPQELLATIPDNVSVLWALFENLPMQTSDDSIGDYQTLSAKNPFTDKVYGIRRCSVGVGVGVGKWNYCSVVDHTRESVRDYSSIATAYGKWVALCTTP